MKKNYILILISLLIFVGCASDDPRKGGFFGGLQGLSTGSYNSRAEAKENELNQTEKNTENLKKDAVCLEKESKRKALLLANEKQRVLNMKSRLLTVRDELGQVLYVSTEQKGEIEVLQNRIQRLLSRLETQKNNIDDLDRRHLENYDSERYLILQKESDMLVDEYNRLIEYSHALTNVAN